MPDTLHENIQIVDEAKKACLTSLDNLRSRINRSISEAEEWVLHNFGLLQHNLSEQATTFKASFPPVVELDTTQPIADLNSRARSIVAAINDHRRRSVEVKNVSIEATAEAKEKKRKAGEVSPTMALLVEETVASLLEPFKVTRVDQPRETLQLTSAQPSGPAQQPNRQNELSHQPAVQADKPEQTNSAESQSAEQPREITSS